MTGSSRSDGGLGAIRLSTGAHRDVYLFLIRGGRGANNDRICVVRNEFESLRVGAEQIELLRRTAKRVEHDEVRIPAIEIEPHFRAVRPVYVKKRRTLAGEGVPFLGDADG